MLQILAVGVLILLFAYNYRKWRQRRDQRGNSARGSNNQGKRTDDDLSQIDDTENGDGPDRPN